MRSLLLTCGLIAAGCTPTINGLPTTTTLPGQTPVPGLPGSGPSVSGLNERAWGSVGDATISSFNGSAYPTSITHNGLDQLVIKAFSDQNVYSNGNVFYRVAAGSDGESIAILAYSLSGTMYGGFVGGSDVSLPSSGAANFAGKYQGEFFDSIFSNAISGDVSLSVDFGSDTVQGQVTNRSFFAGASIDNARIGADLDLSAQLENDGYFEGTVSNLNAAGTLKGTVFGNADGAVGTLEFFQFNSTWGSPDTFEEMGVFSVD